MTIKTELSGITDCQLYKTGMFHEGHQGATIIVNSYNKIQSTIQLEIVYNINHFESL